MKEHCNSKLLLMLVSGLRISQTMVTAHMMVCASTLDDDDKKSIEICLDAAAIAFSGVVNFIDGFRESLEEAKNIQEIKYLKILEDLHYTRAPKEEKLKLFIEKLKAL